MIGAHPKHVLIQDGSIRLLSHYGTHGEVTIENALPLHLPVRAVRVLLRLPSADVYDAAAAPHGHGAPAHCIEIKPQREELPAAQTELGELG